MAGLILSLSAFGESLAAWYFRPQGWSQSSARTAPSAAPGPRACLFCLALTLASSAGSAPGAQGLAGIPGRGGIVTIAYSLASRVIPNEQRASGFGLLSSFTMMGNAFGPILAGLLASINLYWVFLGRRNPLRAAGADGLPAHWRRGEGSG